MMRMSTQRDSLTLMQDPAGQDRTRLSLSGRLDLAVAGLLLDWVDDVCAGPQRDIELDLTDLTFVDEAGARCLAAACSALWADSRSVTVTSGPPTRAAQRDGGQP
jgi:anti-anti-sigma regulatory factor